MSEDVQKRGLVRLQKAFYDAANNYPGIQCLMTEYASDRPRDSDDKWPNVGYLFTPCNELTSVLVHRQSYFGFVNNEIAYQHDKDGRIINPHDRIGREVPIDTIKGRMLCSGSIRGLRLRGDPKGIERFKALASDAARLLEQIDFQSLIRVGIEPDSMAEYEVDRRWVWVVYDLAWQGIPGSPLSASRHVWAGNTSCDLHDLAELREHHASGHYGTDFLGYVEQIPDPPDRFYSVIDDILVASSHAIDLLLDNVFQPSVELTPPVPAPKSETGKPPRPSLPRRAKSAWDQYQRGLEALNTPEATDDEVYDALQQANEMETQRTGKRNPLGLPRRDTWKRNLRLARKALGQQKNKPLAGRADDAGSIANESDI